MKICAVICEYNPFHTGHEYHLREAKKASNCDAVICVMSGNFVQRGEPSALDYAVRAKTAVLHGADAVLVMPAAVSLSVAEKFAFGAVNIISQIKGITHICFGAEANSLPLLKTIASIQEKETAELTQVLKNNLALGLSYPAALADATSVAAEKLGLAKGEVTAALLLPNNVLAIEYLKAINKLNLNIEPICILRKGASYNSGELGQNLEFESASAIRKSVLMGSSENAKNYIPEKMRSEVLFEMIEHKVSDDILSALILYSLRGLRASELTDCPSELREKMIAAANSASNYSEFLAAVKSRRYPLSRLKRIAMYSLLKIFGSTLDFAFPIYSRLIAVSSSFKKHLSVFSSTVVKQNADFPLLQKENLALVECDKIAESVYALITNNGSSPFYKRELHSY